MKRKFARVLSVRRLLEDLAQLEFEKKTAELRRLEEAALAVRRLGQGARAEVLRVLGEGDEPVPWQLGMADAEILAWKVEKIAAMATECRPGVERARAELLARRLERRQVETLMSGVARAEETVDARRAQKQVDDWFQSRAAREKQKARREKEK
ncbi:MAG TPA: hypothetical protein VHX60_15645 [Acidobacteriaceae bacterium]|jgi:ribosomal protein L12E/L44/L45/RPP1/RPP2|nr:hypothetical protein [Acidobacteriaceae bacterium]